MPGNIEELIFPQPSTKDGHAWFFLHRQQARERSAPTLKSRTRLANIRVSPVARPLVPVTLALMAGIAAPAWGLHLPEPWLLAGGAVLWVALALLWWQRRPVRFLPLILFGLLGVAFHQQARQPDFPPGHLANLPQHQNLTLFGHLNRPGKLGAGREPPGKEEPKEEDKDDWVQFSRLEPEGKYQETRVQLFMAAEAWRSPWGWRPAAGNLLVLAPVPEPPPVGTGLVVRGSLVTPRTLQNPGAFNRPRFLAADGLFREMRLSDPHRPIFLAATDAYPWAERLRGGIRERLREIYPAGRAIYLAMLLGDQGEITQEMRQNLARTGTSHLLVINGLHLGMVAAVTYFLSFFLMRRFPRLLLRVNAVKIATLLAAIPVVFYAWVAGGSPSTQRAEVMVLAYLLLVFLGRPGEVWSALALAALVILTLSPLRLFSISFQLSFVAVAGLIYLVPRLVEWISGPASDQPVPGPAGRLLFRVKEWLMVSVVATLATAPLVAFYFQVVSLLGILVNLVAIPLVLLLALPLGEAAVISQAFSLTPVAQALLFLGKLPLWLGYQVIEWGAKVPGSAITMPTPTLLMIAAYYAILILVFYPRRTSLTWAGAGLAGLVLVAAIALPHDHGAPPVGPVRPGLGAVAGIVVLEAVPEPEPGHDREPERGQRRGTAHPGPAVHLRVTTVQPAGPAEPALLGPALIIWATAAPHRGPWRGAVPPALWAAWT